MSYTPNPTWTALTPITVACLNNLETQFDEAYSYLTTHGHDSSYYTESEMDAAFISSENDGSGSGVDADLIYHPDGNLSAVDFAGLGVPTGLIIRWAGAIVNIPSGWHLCDGTGGTKDIRGKMVIGAGGDYGPGDTGGASTFSPTGTLIIAGHILTIAEMGPHRHPFLDTYRAEIYDAPASGSYSSLITGPVLREGTTAATGGGGAHGHTGSSFTPTGNASLPPYYALAYIQKI